LEFVTPMVTKGFTVHIKLLLFFFVDNLPPILYEGVQFGLSMKAQVRVFVTVRHKMKLVFDAPNGRSADWASRRLVRNHV